MSRISEDAKASCAVARLGLGVATVGWVSACGLFACRQCAGRVRCGLLRLHPKKNTHAHTHMRAHTQPSVSMREELLYIGDPLKSLGSILNLQATC